MDDYQGIVENNRQARERLKALVARLSAADLARPLYPGWTVADALAHVAFWDWRALHLVDRWPDEPFSLPDENPVDVDALNEAAFRLARRLSPEQAAQLAVEAADEVDGRIETIGPEAVAAILAAGSPVNLSRAAHREEHVEEIERLL